MEQETPRRIPADDLDREQYLDHSFDLVARVRAAREAAEREMEASSAMSPSTRSAKSTASEPT